MAARRFVVQYCPIPESLERYVSTIFYFEVELDGDCRYSDVLCPDWASLRFHYGDPVVADMRNGESLRSWNFWVGGPRSQEIHFSLGNARQWGVRLSPLGWSAFFGVSADLYADRLVDGDADPVFETLRPLHALIADGDASPGVQLERLVAFLEALPLHAVPHAALVTAIGEALADPEIRASSELAQRVGAHPRMIERVCRAAFGFTPKLLLRRQRFLRSIEHFTLDPTIKWIGAMDEAYHDQAQFVRDFRAFMGMTPRQYAGLDKPLSVQIMRERQRLRLRGRS